jgi:ribosome biogenesis GTPase / thiamine phosphate phosphatase
MLPAMSKRNLSRRQQWRIDKIQEERLARASKRAAREGDAPADAFGDEQHGLVVTHYGQQVIVSADNGSSCRCHFRATLEQLVVGDRVLFQAPRDGGSDLATGVVTAIVPRQTVLRRPDQYGNLKPVAANVDLMLVVFAPQPTPSSVLLDRYLVAAELSDITPLLVLNKADLIGDADRAQIAALCALYRGIGYSVLEVSATEGDGLQPLFQALAGHTSVFVGQSGVGKSSLVNALLPEAALEVSELSSRSGLGQHTTVTAKLFDLPGGGKLIDSPGVREFGLWHISEDELLHGYRDLAPLAGHCKFRNCSHRHEPGCALRLAAETGDISAERLDNFYRIADTLDEEGRERY